MTKRDAALWLIERTLWTPYIWGGDDPSGRDCSGNIIEALQGSGVLPPVGDWTAEMLRKRFKLVIVPIPGCLAFRMNSEGRAVHVGMVWAVLDDGTVLVIEAGGGDSTTQTVADAMRQNAFVKMRPVWPKAVYADPFAVVPAGDV